MAEFEVKLKLSLRRISMISIAQLFWKSPDIIYEISKFNKQKFKSTKKKLRYLHQSSPDSVKDLSSCKYQAWEEVIDCVLKKTSDILFLPCELKDDLQKIIVLMGQKIFYFYDEFWEASKRQSHLTREYFRCKKCIEGSGTEHFYSFSSFGTVVLPCPLLHSKPVPPKNTYSSNLSFLNLFRQYKHNKFKEFLDDIVFYCDVETIEKYEKEIITFLNSLHPGLSFKNKDEIAFSIICLWKMMRPEETFRRKYRKIFDENGYVRVPKKYLSKSKEFTIPLEVVPQLCLDSNPAALQYFANKLHCLDDREHFSIMSEVFMACELHTLVVNNRLHHFPAPDCRQDKILKVLNFMSLNEKYDFIEKHLKDLFMYFFPVWPHQEMIPKILDYCEEKNLDLDYDFLFDLITVCIGIENKNKYKILKGFYLGVFERVWSKAPEKIKMIFFMGLTITLIKESPNNPNLKLILKDEQLKKCAKFQDNEKELYTAVFQSWQNLLLKKNFASVKKFVSELVFLEKQFEYFLTSYDYPKASEITFVRKSYFKI